MSNVHYDEKIPTELIYRKKPVLTVEEQHAKLLKKVKKAEVDLADQVDRRNRYARELREFNKAHGLALDTEASYKSSIKKENTEKKGLLSKLQILGPDGKDLFYKDFNERQAKFRNIFDGLSLQVDPFNKTINVSLNTKKVKND